VATALPESVIPVIALIQGASMAQQEIAIGAIIGAPFLLGTLAMAIVGFSAYMYKNRRGQDEEIQSEIETGQRDFAFFVAFFGLAILIGAIGAPAGVRIPAAILFVIAYVGYTYWTVKQGKGGEGEPDEPLYFDWTRDDPPNNFQLIAQLVVSIAAIVGGANLFVAEIEAVAMSIGIPILVLALVLAPLATELPEKLNSVIWVREGKDSLALGNITGAMVFQSTLPVAFGLAFTTWELQPEAIVAGVVGLVGGSLAWWRLHQRSFGGRYQLVWLTLFVGFVVYALVAA
jgi:cation:H+ antiporter